MKENYFLAKWLNDQLTSQELDEFKSTSEYAAFEKIKHYSSQLSTPNFNESMVLENVLKTKKEQPKVIAINSRTWFSRIAAVLILSLGITYFYLSTKVETQFANNNSKQTFLLPDDSQVVLNSGSNATYNSFKWDDKREINLDGEAYFKVAKGKVFDVITSQGKVTVVGTQFNVTHNNK
jgi:transmembrane sensor